MSTENLHQPNLSPKKQGPSTLEYVDVQEIHDGIVILRDGSFRAILAVSSLNFDLKSSDEQDAIIFRYQQFLNSLDFPLQSTIHSRRINIAPYLEMLKIREAEQTDELMRMQIYEYRNFIKNLTEVQNIMTKSFFVVVPFFPVEKTKKGIFSELFQMFNQDLVIKHKLEKFETYKSQLLQRVDHVVAGLSGMGLRLALLTTEETVELLYNSYNPSLFSMNIINDIESMETQNRITR
ncbi:MAG: hypothetical protein IPN70_02555 [Candidatus Moraniibacteriota bacterium]|nr:MAG: hypothetical protein IPN70_02555 [Candidatus Moranbacteria bacterium]